MLAFGLLSLGLAAFFFWVMMQGESFITANDWADAMKQVGKALHDWLSPNSSAPTAQTQA